MDHILHFFQAQFICPNNPKMIFFNPKSLLLKVIQYILEFEETILMSKSELFSMLQPLVDYKIQLLFTNKIN